MTNTIVTSRSTPFEFLINYLNMLGGFEDEYANWHSQEGSLSVSRYQPGPDYDHCLPCSKCGLDSEMIVLAFSKEFEGRLISFFEHTCTKCTERQYSV